MVTHEGTFTAVGQCSAQMPYLTGIKLWLKGLDASNTVALERSTNNGHTWSTVTTYNSDQTAVAVADVANAHHRLRCTAIQALKHVRYKLSAESVTNAPA